MDLVEPSSLLISRLKNILKVLRAILYQIDGTLIIPSVSGQSTAELQFRILSLWLQCGIETRLFAKKKLISERVQSFNPFAWSLSRMFTTFEWHTDRFCMCGNHHSRNSLKNRRIFARKKRAILILYGFFSRCAKSEHSFSNARWFYCCQNTNYELRHYVCNIVFVIVNKRRLEHFPQRRVGYTRIRIHS